MRLAAGLASDLAAAARSLARSRGTAAAAVLALALGIGAATAVFSAVDAVLLRPLPLAGAALLLAAGPARRTAAVDPVVALTAE
jgi:putative ABC transport system permease protein